MARIRLRGGGDGGSNRKGKGAGLLGRGVLALLGVVFLGLGLFATYAMMAEVAADLATRSWAEAECTIRESEVLEPSAETHGEWDFRVAYDWRWEGARYSGDQVSRGLSSSLDLAETQRLLWLYPAGAVTACRVDPEAPENAVLEHGSLAEGWVALLPLVFSAVGAFVLVMVFRREGQARPAPVTIAKEKQQGLSGCLVGFFLIFAAVGLAFFVPFFLVPALHTWEARDWPAVPATVLSSGVASHSSDDGTTYSIDVVYRYEVDGREVLSGRYDFMAGSSSGYEGKAAIADLYPEGAETVAYVDPEAPWRAVLSHDFRKEWLFALLPLLFVAVGFGGAGWVLSAHLLVRRKEEAGIESWLPPETADDRMEAGALVLEEEWTPIGKMFGALVISLLWNGIVGVFVWLWWQEYRSGSPDGCLTLFLIPFVLVGLLLLVSVPYQFLAAFNPRPVLTLDRRRLEPGTDATLQWGFRGKGERIRHLKITFEGREKATYTVGTTTRTDTETFAEIVLADSDWSAARGSAQLTIPADTMHSFEAANNKVEWVLKLHGTIDRWPDVLSEFPLVVHPRRIGP